MNEVLQTRLVEILDLGKNGILQAVDMLKKEMPDLMEQIVMWEFTKSLISFLMCPIMIFVTWRVCEYFYKKCEKDDVWEFYLSPRLGNLFSLCWPLFLDFTWLKILFVPKLFLIEYISNLVR